MGRSVSVPSNAEVVAYQYHRSYWYCHDCDEELDYDTCPNDMSDHDIDFGEEQDYCHTCEEWVDSDHFDPHIVTLTTDWLDWDEFIYDVQQGCQEEWPSLEKIDVWVGKEDHAILENDHVKIGVSGYCGLVSVWIVPQDNDYYPEHLNLAYHWIGQIEDKFRKMFGELQKIGCFSNGNAVYRKVA